MPKHPSDERMPVPTPRSELERLRAETSGDSPELRSRIMESMLICCGEVGYRNVAVRRVYERYGGHRVQFYRNFAGKEACFLAAYESESERLCRELLEIARGEGDRRKGLEAALREVAALMRERPALAKGIFIEAHVAGGPAMDKHHELFERLSRAVDNACRETESRHFPPPTTASFIIGVIEQAVSSALSRGDPEEFAAEIPALTALFGSAYAGDSPQPRRDGTPSS